MALQSERAESQNIEEQIEQLRIKQTGELLQDIFCIKHGIVDSLSDEYWQNFVNEGYGDLTEADIQGIRNLIELTAENDAARRALERLSNPAWQYNKNYYS